MGLLDSLHRLLGNDVQLAKNIYHAANLFDKQGFTPAPPIKRTYGERPVIPRPTAFPISSPQQPTSINLQGPDPGNIQQPRGFNYSLPNYPTYNPQGVPTYSTPLTYRRPPFFPPVSPLPQTQLPLLPRIQ